MIGVEDTDVCVSLCGCLVLCALLCVFMDWSDMYITPRLYGDIPVFLVASSLYSSNLGSIVMMDGIMIE